MYRKQLTWQKILCFAAIAVSAIVFLYALGLMTDLYDSLYSTMPYPDDPDVTDVPGSQVYYHMQPYNKQLLSISIIMILLSCLLFITSTHSRRRYYISNAVSTFGFAGAGIWLSIWTHMNIADFKAKFLAIDFTAYAKYATRRKKDYIDSTFWFDAHYVVVAILLVVCVALVINYFWKLSLMKAEKRLINEGKGGITQ